MPQKNYGKPGWFNESQRHSLAAQGVKTGNLTQGGGRKMFEDFIARQKEGIRRAREKHPKMVQLTEAELSAIKGLGKTGWKVGKGIAIEIGRTAKAGAGYPPSEKEIADAAKTKELVQGFLKKRGLPEDEPVVLVHPDMVVPEVSYQTEVTAAKGEKRKTWYVYGDNDETVIEVPNATMAEADDLATSYYDTEFGKKTAGGISYEKPFGVKKVIKIPEGFKAKPKKGFDLVSNIIAFEDGSLSKEGTIKLFQHLVDTGQAWRLQGFYGRTANDMLEQGLINPPKEKTKESTTDYYGQKIDFDRYKKKKILSVKGAYSYKIRDFVYPKGKQMNQTEMIKYAKGMLQVNKRQGLDTEYKSSDLSEPINAWVYLKNIGIGESTNRKTF